MLDKIKGTVKLEAINALTRLIAVIGAIVSAYDAETMRAFAAPVEDWHGVSGTDLAIGALIRGKS